MTLYGTNWGLIQSLVSGWSQEEREALAAKAEEYGGLSFGLLMDSPYPDHIMSPDDVRKALGLTGEGADATQPGLLDDLDIDREPSCNCPLADTGPDLIACRNLPNCELT